MGEQKRGTVHFSFSRTTSRKRDSSFRRKNVGQHNEKRRCFVQESIVCGDMASGIEVVGLTLAVLPLLINQVDGYVQGCERLKLLNDRKYFHQHKRWKLQLETEQIFLNNALETVLYDEVVKSKVKMFFDNPRPESRPWDAVALEAALQSRLGPLYAIFKNNLTEVELALGKVCKKLDIDPTCPQEVSDLHLPRHWTLHQYHVLTDVIRLTGVRLAH